MGIRIITDSAADFDLAVAKRRQVDVVPMEIFTDPDMRRKYPEYCHRTLHIFLARTVSETVRERTETDFQQTGSVWVAPEEAETLPLVPLQLRGRVREVLNAAGPVYLGSVCRDEVCM